MLTIFHSPCSSCSLLPQVHPDTLKTSEPNHSHALNPLCGLNFCHQSHSKVPEDPGVPSSSIWFFITYNPRETQGHVLSHFLYPIVLTSPSARTWNTPVHILEGSLSRTPSTFPFSSHIFSVFELPPHFTAKAKSYKRGNKRWAESLWRKWSSSTAALAQEAKILKCASDKARVVLV